MQDLVTFLSTKMSYEEDPTCIFEEYFPQFLAMYNFIAPSINYIKHIVVMNYNTYALYFFSPIQFFYDIMHNKTTEINGQVYRSMINFDSNSLILRIKKEES